jgi:hypothetical protein
MRYGLVTSALLAAAWGTLSSASAQYGRIRPECRGMTNPRSCSCALDKGGRIMPDHHRPGRLVWRSPKRGSGAHMAFMNCAIGSGR